MPQYPQLFQAEACEAADEACRPLDRQAALARVNRDWDAYTKAATAKKVLWLDTYLAAAAGKKKRDAEAEKDFNAAYGEHVAHAKADFDKAYDALRDK